MQKNLKKIQRPETASYVIHISHMIYDMQHTIHIFEKTNNNLILYSLQLLFTNQFCMELKI